MTSQVSLPLWLMLIVGALALWSVVDRLLIPGVRYLMRRRFNRAIDELNTRLKLRIQPFKLAKRQALIDGWVGGLMMRNSEIEETGVAAGVLGHPAMGVAWLANKLGTLGVALEPGHLVLAGSF